MNVIQLQHNLNHLLCEVKKKNQEEIKRECLKLIHRYCIYFIGNKNYLQDYNDNKITLLGILDQLIIDICQTFVPGPVAMVPGGLGINVSMIQELCSELSMIAYGV
jgi:hypothetical protein